MSVDTITKLILDSIEIKPKDEVELTIEKEEMGDRHQLVVLVNKFEHKLSILYTDKNDFQEELPMYESYFQCVGANLKKAA